MQGCLPRRACFLVSEGSASDAVRVRVELDLPLRNASGHRARPWLWGRMGGAVGLRQRCVASTAPASGRTPNAAPAQRRRAGLLTPATPAYSVGPPEGLGRGGTRPSHGMLSPREEAGPLGARAVEGPLQAAKRWPGGVVHLQEQQQRRNDRSTQPRKNGPGRGAVDTSLEGRSVSIPADQPVLKSGREESFVGSGALLAQRAPAAAVPAQRPCQGVRKLRCTGSGTAPRGTAASDCVTALPR
jgi:hypothetical protein